MERNLNPNLTVITLSPAFFVWAIAHTRGGEMRLWAVCRSLSVLIDDGGGAVELDILRRELIRLGVDDATVSRWIADAVSDNFVIRDERESGITVIRPVSAEKIATRFQIHADRRVEFDANELLSAEWRRIVWQSFIRTSFNGKTISRETLEKITGIERHTQRRLERSTKTKPTSIRNTVNIVNTKKSPEFAEGYCDSGRQAFVRDGRTVYRLPDTRKVQDDAVVIAPRGRVSKINRYVAGHSSLHGAGVKKPTTVRLFFETRRQANRALRRYGAADSVVREVFVRSETLSGYAEWERVS
jgi:hypothetical protein